MLGAFHAWSKLASDTKRADFYCHAGSTAMKLGRWIDAQKAFEDASQRDSCFPLPMLMMGSLFLSRDDGDPLENAKIANSWLSQALEIDRTAMALSLMGAAFSRLGEKDRAKKAYRDAIQVDGSYEEAYFNLGILVAEDGDDAQAERLLRKAIELDPSLLVARGRLGALLQKWGRHLEAEYEFRRCIDIDPADYFSHLHLADVLVAEGRKNEAEQEYRRALAIRPREALAIRRFARFLENLSRNKEADELRSRLLHPERSNQSPTR
jgi:Tfp pilus assembly protein PilF